MVRLGEALTLVTMEFKYDNILMEESAQVKAMLGEVRLKLN